MPYTAIDLAKLPAPTVIEPLDYETIFATLVRDLVALDPAYSALVESDLIIKLLEDVAARELLLRARINDAARAVLLATATGSNLDHLAALFAVSRLMLDPGNANAIPPVPPRYEIDTDLRRRTQLALEGITTAGSAGSYVFHALGADAGVGDAIAVMPAPGHVDVYILARDGDGAPSPELLAAVDAALNADHIRPLTDLVTVKAPAITAYAVSAIVTAYPGPDPEIVRQAAEDTVRATVSELRGLGKDVPLSALYAALHRPGVHRVSLAAPVADIICSDVEAAYCTGVTVVGGGVGT